MPQGEAQPYAFPFDGDLDPAKTAVILIDMQIDFCGRGGYVHQMGYDVNATRAPIEPLQRILKAARRTGCADALPGRCLFEGAQEGNVGGVNMV